MEASQLGRRLLTAIAVTQLDRAMSSYLIVARLIRLMVDGKPWRRLAYCALGSARGQLHFRS